jgi:uncharacterized membrane-anchored protein YitT (DUF2179 family)
MSKKVLKQVMNYILVVLGTFLLSFGAVIFLTECELVSGGIPGIAIIIQHFVTDNIYDYLVAGLTALFWFIGLIFVGKDFAIKTLLSSILYVGFTFLFKRVDFFVDLSKQFAGTATAGTDPTVGNYMLCGIFGGVFVGGGVALTFLGGGSTGGVDVIQVLMNKYLKVKESISSFIIDAVIIAIGMASMQLWVPALCGVLSAFFTAALIEVVYIRNQTSYQADIISNEWEKISQFVQEELERGATIIRAEGGYKGEERPILRVVFPKTQYEKLRDYIASVDPSAFVTFTQTNAVYGEGFQSNRRIIKRRKK